jgi:hypothetical protein
MMHRSRRPVALALAAVQLMTACFQYVPVRTDPAPGVRVALEINDEGRVALAPALGPGVVRIEGVLVATESDVLVVDAMMVTQLRLRPTAVDRIRVRVARAHVVLTEERRMSRKRTILAVGGAVVAVVSFFVSKGWFGRSTPPDGNGGGGRDQ